jgi:hypothetical protein
MIAETKIQTFADMTVRGIRIIYGARGFPIRNVAAQGHTKPTGIFMSRKCGRAMPWESFHELHLMWISECDTAVWRFLAQPFRLEFYVRNRAKPIVYFPDIERELDGGTIEVIEVKKTKEQINRDPFYAFKIEMAKKVFRTAGYRFRIMTADDHIGIEPRLGNAKMIKLDRFTKLETADIIRLHEAIEHARGNLPYGKAIEVLGAGGVRHADARAKLHASIVQRLASIDLNRRITFDSPITEVKTVRRHQKAA